jgi:HD-GYP domain-containing protein (c-di-GMP phosphodiesterase class II)
MSDETEIRAEPTVCGLYHGPGIEADSTVGSWRPAEELFAAGPGLDSPAVLLVDASLLERVAAAHAIPEHVVIIANDVAALGALGPRVAISLAGISDAATRKVVLLTACQLAIARLAATHSHAEFKVLSKISIGLMREHDRKALIRLIVTQGKQLTHSDGGGLLLTEADENGRLWLRPVLHWFDSIEGAADAPAEKYPLDRTSIIGHAAIIKQPVVIKDAYDLPYDANIEHGAAWDEKWGYRRRSMLAVPMIDQTHRVLGVLLFINRKIDPDARITSKEAADRYVVPYSEHEVLLARLLASQAAVAIENARLYAQIERTLESFVKASVSAIDLRDPTTAGHALRVATLVTRLAEAIERRSEGPYADVHFTAAQLRELRFAALLHDFGKVAVREDVLLKEKKLPPALWERVDARFNLIRRTLELESCNASACQAAADGPVTPAARLDELEHFHQLVTEANEPTMLDAPTAAELSEIAERTFVQPDGTIAPYITPEELHFLQLPKGTLDEHEREEVHSHVTKTYQYLSHIPWTDDLNNLVSYAYGHHEKLDGSGYPRQLKAGDIPLQTRLITVADMFDALTASDRPYKPSVSADQALEILRSEAEAGRLDAELVKVMAESQVHRTLLKENWRELLSIESDDQDNAHARDDRPHT